MEQVNKSEIQRARNSLRPSWYDGKTINYFNKVIDILEVGKYARVKLTDSTYEGAIIDIECVAFTNRFASVFDMLNHHNCINYDVEPESVDKLEYPLVKFDFYS